MRRSRANPFKSTQLRQWGFICYLGGHIVSRRERTDRLRRASDGAAPREPAPTARRRSKGTTLSPYTPLQFPPFYFTAATLLVVDVAAIRQKSGFAVTRPRRNFPRIARTTPCSRCPLLTPARCRPFSFSFFSRNFRWKNMAFCLRFCIVNVQREREREGEEERDRERYRQR